MTARKTPEANALRRGAASKPGVSSAASDAAAHESGRAIGSPNISFGGLDLRVGYLLRRAQMSVFRDFIQGMAEYDIRPAQFSILTVIGANPGLSQRDLGQSLAIEPARLVLMLDELERRDLCRRNPSPNDRRSRMLILTPQGKRQLARLNELADQHEARALSKLTQQDSRRLLDLLRLLLD